MIKLLYLSMGYFYLKIDDNYSKLYSVYKENILKKKDNYSYHYYREITQIMNYILDNCNKIYLKKPLIHYI